jgi:hypothetical protein
MAAPVESIMTILRVARAFGWTRGLHTATYLSVERGEDRIAFAVDSDGTITVSGGSGTNFATIEPLRAIDLLV